MVLDAFTMKRDNDNDELPFITLSAATRNVTRYLKLEEQEKNPAKNKPNPGKDAGNSINQDRAFVEHRLREIADWERRIREDRLRYKNRKRT